MDLVTSLVVLALSILTITSNGLYVAKAYITEAVKEEADARKAADNEIKATLANVSELANSNKEAIATEASTARAAEKANADAIAQEIKDARKAEEANANRTVVDQFIFMNNNYDLATMGQISNLTGGHVFYYPFSLENNAMSSNYEKLHYDITRIISRPNYYDVKFMIRFTLGLDCSEILGSFNKFLGEAFQLGGCDPDFSYFYNLRMNETFKNEQKIDFQIVCLYNDNFGQRYLRIFNSTYNMTEDVAKIFSSCDVDAMAKAMLMKEISLSYRSDFVTIRKNLEDRIINSFKFYRVKEKSSTPPGQLILPVSIKVYGFTMPKENECKTMINIDRTETYALYPGENENSIFFSDNLYFSFSSGPQAHEPTPEFL